MFRLAELETSGLITCATDSWSDGSPSTLFTHAGGVGANHSVASDSKGISVKSIALPIPVLILLKSSSRISYAAINALMSITWFEFLESEEG